ncbi:MAG: hypothetical protein ABI553_06325 [Chloroflexota bacterium]
MTETEPGASRGARWRGALAGLVPTAAIVLLFAASGTSATPGEVAVSLAAFGAIATIAGFLAGLRAQRSRGLLAGAFAYALALLVTNFAAGMIQATWETWTAQGLDPLAIVTAIGGRAAYGFISTAYLIVPALVAGVAWTFAVRGLERLTGARPPSTPAAGRATRDPRRLGLGAAGIIVGYALVVAAVSAGARGGLGEFSPPEVIPRPVLLAVLGTLAAAVGAIGAMRRSRPVLVAAGIVCLAQSFIAFSGITIPFIVPAFLLLGLGAEPGEDRTPARAVVGGVLVLVLGLAAWVAPFALTETSCWVARSGAGGGVVYAPIPVPAGMTSGSEGSISGEGRLELGDLASGCDGGQLTAQGAGLAAIFGIGAVAMAGLSAIQPAKRRVVPEPIA